MSNEEYILEEKRVIEEASGRSGLSPEQWISKNAGTFHRKYAKSITPVCRPWFTYIKENYLKGGE